MMTGIGLGFGLLGLVFMGLFWVGLIALGVWFVRALFPGKKPSSDTDTNPSPNAREILDQRYARGEITREQYVSMRNEIH